MKITIFGLTISSSWGNGHATPYRAIVRALARMGHQVTFYEEDAEYYALRRDMPECGFCKLVIYPDWASIRTKALQEASESDVVMTASYLKSGTLINDEILALGRPLKVFYDLDTPVTLAKWKAGPVDYVRTDQISEFDLVFSWTGGTALEQLQVKYGARMARPIFGCVDPDTYVRTSVREAFRCALSYMGTYAADRQQKVEELFLQNVRRFSEKQFVLAGTMYPWQWQWPENVKRFDHIAPHDHSALYSSSRLTLNITRADMASTGYCPSGRFFEAAACGTPIISDWFNGLDAFFTPGKEIVIASKSDDVIAALQMSDEELGSMAKFARQRTLDEHTGHRRATRMLAYFEEAVQARDHNQFDLLEAAS